MRVRRYVPCGPRGGTGMRVLGRCRRRYGWPNHVRHPGSPNRWSSAATPDGLSQWPLAADVGYAGRHDRAPDPEVRPRTYFPSLLPPRRRAEEAQSAVVQEAYGQGVSMPQLDELMKALGSDGVSAPRRRVSVASSTRWSRRYAPGRSAAGSRCGSMRRTTRVRVDGRVMSQATIVAVGVSAGGERQVLGVDVGPSEDRAFWTACPRSLVERGLHSVKLVISSAATPRFLRSSTPLWAFSPVSMVMAPSTLATSSRTLCANFHRLPGHGPTRHRTNAISRVSSTKRRGR